jgi:hypothetical protein
MYRKLLHIVLLLLLILPGYAQEKKQSVYEITRIPVNEGAFSEISPVIYNDGIIFCSDRRFSAVKDRKSFDGRRLYNLYFAQKKDSTQWEKPDELTSERSKLFNNGPLCIAPDGKTVYFTSEIETGPITKKRSFRNHSGIFVAELSGMDLKSLSPFPFNNPQYDIGQPSISRDGKYLFFASNMPGGQGGSDLYYCEWINGQWSSPANLGAAVNSQSAESFPFMHSSGRLYFSSNRSGGKGRMDVYYTVLSHGAWEEPIPLAEPINSSRDDFAFVADTDLQTGYFSSNRRNNDDIYQFKSMIIRKASCDSLLENSYCFEIYEENAIRYQNDSLQFRYEWNFGDGSPRGFGPSVVHCYAAPGIYIVRLDAVNLVTGEIIYDQKIDTIPALEEEQPYISGPDAGFTGQKLTFNADSTNLPGWNITKYYWNFDDENIAVGKEVDNTYLRPGSYNIQLIVTDEPGPGGVVREACVCKNIVISRQP